MLPSVPKDQGQERIKLNDQLKHIPTFTIVSNTSGTTGDKEEAKNFAIVQAEMTRTSHHL